MPELISHIHGFIGKLDNWYHKTLNKNFAMFQPYTEYVDSSNQIPQTEIQDNIITHLINLSDELKMYIPEIDNHLYNITLYTLYADIKDIDEYKLKQSELIMIQHHIGPRFETKGLGYLWIYVKISYQHLFNLIIKYI